MKKILKLCVIFLLISITLQSIAFAADDPSSSFNTIKGKIGVILNAVAWIGYAVALGMVIYIGIKYTMAAANEKANLKQGVINYLIGVCLIVCASAISNIVSLIATGGTTSSAKDMAKKIVSVAQEVAGTSVSSTGSTPSTTSELQARTEEINDKYGIDATCDHDNLIWTPNESNDPRSFAHTAYCPVCSKNIVVQCNIITNESDHSWSCDVCGRSSSVSNSNSTSTVETFDSNLDLEAILKNGASK